MSSTTPVKTISQKYRKYLPEIARIFVESGMNMAETVRRVAAQLPALSKFRWEHFARWKGNREWESAVQQAQSEAALRTVFSPQVRGQQFIAWAKETLEHLEGIYKDLKEEKGCEKSEKGGEKEKRDLEGRIQTLHTNLRAEERHLDDLEQRRAQRNMRQFAANVLEIAGQVTSIEECRARLEEVRREPLALMKGIE
ncbi:MAG TPA: hypothetical protein VM487_14745 [Phycisphaerae bacterium]|nr:hypothetical protein [Phycisphaerae bacterium]